MAVEAGRLNARRAEVFLYLSIAGDLRAAIPPRPVNGAGAKALREFRQVLMIARYDIEAGAYFLN